MSQPDDPVAPEMPSEDDTLTGGDDGDSFDLDRFTARLVAGKYDGFEVAMSGLLHARAISENTRRWVCTFKERPFREEDLPAEVAEHAEHFASQGWGYLTAMLGDNIRAYIGPARAVLYGICRAELGMDDRRARLELKAMTAQEVLGCFDWEQVTSPGKDGPPA